MRWDFKKLVDGDTKVDPAHLEFFHGDALDDTVSALIREDIQNRLDANRTPLGPLKLRYLLSPEGSGLDAARSKKWLSGLPRHLSSQKTLKELRIEKPFELERAMPYLVIEGFNTSGLKGDPLQTKDESGDAERNDFYWFIRNHYHPIS